jgi:glycosyltransferase involved in cell wall biosynthesis
MLVPPLLAECRNVPYILLVRGILGRNLEQNRGFPGVRTTLNFVSGLNIRQASEVYVAYEDAKAWVDTMVPSDHHESQVLPNAVDPDLFHPMPASEARRKIGLGQGPSGFMIGFVGSLKQRHGLIPLIHGLSEFKTQSDQLVKLLIVGDGPQREELEALVSQEGLEACVIFRGLVPHYEVPAYISACDVLYGAVDSRLPSNPIKCYEYLSCGRPIITTDVSAFSFVRERNMGCTIGAAKPGEIADAIEKLCLVGEAERSAMGNRGREYVTEHHTWEQFADVIVDGAQRALLRTRKG